MAIMKLVLHHFRNLSRIDLDTSAQFNIFVGKNGAGKTSLLEAIYYLGHCRSFRSKQLTQIIQYNQQNFQLYAEINHNNLPARVGIERTLNCGRKIRINGQTVPSIATIAEILPLQFISTESYRFFHDGPKRRRQYLDWGVFHVEPQFFPLWAELQRVYKQRSACLKNHGSLTEIAAWNKQFVSLATPIDAFRRQYVDALRPIFHELLSSMLPIELNIIYNRGWDEQTNLANILNSNYQRDLQLGFTYYGPNRADIQLYIGKSPAHEHLSQGQQKTVSYLLLVAQGILMQRLTGHKPIYLIDDLPSELDHDNREKIAKILTEIGAQIFITAINKNDLPPHLMTNSQTFQIQAGKVAK